MLKCLKLIGFLLFVAIASGFIVIYSGIYPVAADDEHTAPVYWALETLREHSVEAASEHIEVPDLSDPELLLSGGADYNDMCAGCHLKPGLKESDLSVGLYPVPPNLTMEAHEAHEHGSESEELKARFWTIKHGIKASGMPAWGKTHSDERIWAMVAFLEKLPELTEEQYQILTARGE